VTFSYDRDTTPRTSGGTKLGSGTIRIPKVWPDGMPGIQPVKIRPPRPAFKRDEQLQITRTLVKQMRKEGLAYEQICGRLGNRPRPPHASWRALPWPRAYREHTSAVMKWLSLASK
jgi:hypothetical protein